jgi:hypothetical protein
MSERARPVLAPSWARLLIGGAATLLVGRLVEPSNLAAEAVFAARWAAIAAACSLAADLDLRRPRLGLATATAVTIGLAVFLEVVLVQRGGEGFSIVLGAAGIAAAGALRAPPGVSRIGGAVASLAVIIASIPVVFAAASALDLYFPREAQAEWDAVFGGVTFTGGLIMAQSLEPPPPPC